MSWFEATFVATASFCIVATLVIIWLVVNR
jgi:hypothetical protein